MTALTYNLVTPGYFNTLRIPIVRGRHFTASEIDQRAAVVVISESIACMLWPGEDPLEDTDGWQRACNSGRWPAISGVS
jgi:hypothetical protein